ncbi:hypothetical protein [Streptomyces sp. NPDC059943]|uniref:glycosyltransferase family 39 protein n=1 Tax=Streptomyces sp. NPDC059943 TaxID=3347010 RepID=UPI003664E400
MPDEPSRYTHLLVPAALALVLGLWGIRRAGTLWADEAVTLEIAQRDVPEIWQTLGTVDAVHGLYYLLMHGIFALWPLEGGPGLVALRLPSVLATAAASAGVGALGGRLAGKRVGLLAGLVFPLLPVVQRYAQEGRSYALVCALVTWSTWLLLRAVERPGRRRLWAAYAAVLLVTSLLHEFAVLTLLAHGATLTRSSIPATTRRAWRLACCAVLAGLAPLAIFSLPQSAQIDWIGPPTPLELLSFGGLSALGLACAYAASRDGRVRGGGGARAAAGAAASDPGDPSRLVGRPAGRLPVDAASGISVARTAATAAGAALVDGFGGRPAGPRAGTAVTASGPDRLDPLGDRRAGRLSDGAAARPADGAPQRSSGTCTAAASGLGGRPAVRLPVAAARPAGAAPERRSAPAPARGPISLPALALPLLVLPSGLLIALSPLRQLYVDRYVLFYAVGLALLVAAAIDRVARSRRHRLVPYGVVVLAVAAVFGALVPVGGHLRGPDSRKNDVVAIAEAVRETARAGDGLMFMPSRRRVWTLVRPADFRGLTDLALRRDPRASHTLYGTELPAAEIRERVPDFRRIVAVHDVAGQPLDDTAQEVAKRAALREGYEVCGTRRVTGAQITVYARPGAC